jgi:hypothetical protein
MPPAGSKKFRWLKTATLSLFISSFAALTKKAIFALLNWQNMVS